MIEAAGIDAADVARFDRLGASWWDPRGPMAALHALNPVRLTFLRDGILAHFGGADSREAAQPSPPRSSGMSPLRGLTVLDIGCGGGLLSEPLARLGATVTGIDAAEGAIRIAGVHAERAGLAIDYQATSAEALLAEGRRFDVVLAMEVVEHVPDRRAFVRTAGALVRPGGLFFGATLNRTAKSFALAIVAAEVILRWLPRGTHRWDQFVTPREFEADLRAAGLRVTAQTGVIYDPLRRVWRRGRDTGVNYMLQAEKRA